MAACSSDARPAVITSSTNPCAPRGNPLHECELADIFWSSLAANRSRGTQIPSLQGNEPTCAEQPCCEGIGNFRNRASLPNLIDFMQLFRSQHVYKAGRFCRGTSFGFSPSPGRVRCTG